MNDDQKLIELLAAVLELNSAIAKQNALIVQMLTLPQLMIKGDDDER